MSRTKFMLKPLLIALLLGFSILGMAQLSSEPLSGVLRVKFKPTLTSSLDQMSVRTKNGKLSTGLKAFDVAAQTAGASDMRRLYYHGEQNEQLLRKHNLHLWYEISIDAGIKPLEAVKGFARVHEVEIAEPVYPKYIGGTTSEPLFAPAADVSRPPVDPAPSNDIFLDKQWHYYNTGAQVQGALAGADINLFEAWKVETGKSHVVVAIVDGGIDVKHDDLLANLWVNEKEKNGQAGVDDDGNGKVDDVNGYNFVYRVGNVTAHDHGTHVAGTVGAVSNNEIGVAGVAGGSGKGDGVRLMSCQVFSADGGAASNFGDALIYGALNGAVIAQNSWGYNLPDVYEQSVFDAIDFFIAEAGKYEGSPMKGGVVIFAAGNNGANAVYYPGSYPNVINVGSIASNYKRADYSNYHTSVDIVAPGGDQLMGSSNGVLSTYPGKSYAYLQGTSMACPHVSGVAALVVSKYGGVSFTNEDLKKHLLTSVRDVYAYNPGLEGTLGFGLIDARMALDEDRKLAPAQVTDLAVNAAQDFATVKFTHVADEDDGKAFSYTIYYGKSDITDANKASAGQVTIEAASYLLGALIEFDVTGLDASTQYYFTIESADRWGNLSGVVTNVTATTNSGPVASVTPDAYFADIDVTLNPEFNDFLTISNTGEGFLKWSVRLKHKFEDFGVYPYQSSIKLPQVTPMSKAGKVLRKPIPQYHTVTSPANPVKSYDLKYYTRAVYFGVGEQDLTRPNSMATQFYVDEAEGFNLTGASFVFFNDDAVGGPAIMEVYLGKEATPDKLVARKEVPSNGTQFYNHKVDLDENEWFPQGSWITLVLHVPPGNVYPLGLGPEEDESYSDFCFYSADYGQTWVPVAQVLENDATWVWGVSLISRNKNFADYIQFSPDKGDVLPGESGQIPMAVNASALINGNYSANVVVSVNDPAQKEIRVPVTLSVKGQIPELYSAPVVDFGNVFVGEELIFDIEIGNKGLGAYWASWNYPIVSSNMHYDVMMYPWNIGALQSGTLRLRFKPTEAGIHEGNVVLADDFGHSYTLNFFGIGVNPPELTIAQKVLDAGSLAQGDTETETSVTFTNTGNYPLQYAFPGFVESNPIQNYKMFLNKFGYGSVHNVYSSSELPYQFRDISQTGQDITVDVSDGDELAIKTIDFPFPFYGQNHQKIHIWRYGVITFDHAPTIALCGPPDPSESCMSDLGYISATYHDHVIDRNSRVYYLEEDDAVYVTYQNVGISGYYGRLTFQIVMHSNGDIDLVYDNVWDVDELLRRSFYIGIADKYRLDPYGASYMTFWQDYSRSFIVNNQNMVRILYPGSPIVKSVSKPNGTLGIGASETITLKVSGNTKYLGDNYMNVPVITNSPKKKIDNIRVNVHITGDVQTALAVEPEGDIQLGDIFKGATVITPVVLRNTGNLAVDVTEVTLANGHFTLDHADLPVHVLPEAKITIRLVANTADVALLADELMVKSSDGNEFKVVIGANVVEPPQVSVSESAWEETLNHGETAVRDITVSNPGAYTLNVSPINYHWYKAEPKTDQLPISSAYDVQVRYATRNNEWGVPVDVDNGFDWIHIQTPENYLGADYFADQGANFKEIELPFDFPYMNITSNKLWIGVTGFCTLEKPKVDYPYIFPEQLPSKNWNAMIIPYWGIHSEVGFDSYTGVGIYYKIFADKVVVTFNDYMDGVGASDAYDFQMILYKDGTIRFQYSIGNMFLDKGMIGLCHDGKAMLVSDFNKVIENKLVIQYTPVHTYQIAAGESLVFETTMDAGRQAAGTSTEALKFNNNSVDNAQASVALTMNVVAPEELSFSVNEISLDTLMIQVDADGLPLSAYTYFDVVNSGKTVLEFLPEYDEFWNANSAIYFEEPLSDVVIEYGFRNYINYLPMDWYEWWPHRDLELQSGFNHPFRLKVTPSEAGTIETNLVFKSASQNLFKLPVKIVRIGAPKVGVSDGLSFHADLPSYTAASEVVVSNVEGASKLKYAIKFEFSDAVTGSKKVSKTSAFALSGTTQMKEVKAAETIAAPQKQKTVLPDNRVLQFESAAKPSSNLGFGVEVPFTSACAFTAPADGFNLSHVRTWFRAEGVNPSSIYVEVYRGAHINDANLKLVSEGELIVNVETLPDNTGAFCTVALNEPVLFYPNEKFFVWVYYPLGVGYPQGCANVDGSDNSGICYYYSGVEWADLSGYSATLAYMIRAVETEFKESSWIKFTDTVLAGELLPGESRTLPLTIDARFARSAENRANILVNSNDPEQPQAVIPVVLTMNTAPQMVLQGDVPVVAENSSIVFEVQVTDRDGNAFTVEKQDAASFTTMSVEGNLIRITVAPDYTMAGVHDILLTAVDEFGAVSELSIPITVLNVNRAPVAVTSGESMEMTIEEANRMVDLSTLFTDVDADPLSFTASADNGEVAVLYLTDASLLIDAVKVGQAHITITASDPYGESATYSIQLTAQNRVGIDDELAQAAFVKTYPNPVVDVLNVVFGAEAQGKVTLQLHDASGKLLHQEEVDALPGMQKRMNMKQMSSGNYTLTFVFNQKVITKKLMKK